MYLSEIIEGQVMRREVSGILFDQSCDVVISGVGTAGLMALILTAKNGLKVLGIERHSCAGGISTIGGVEAAYFDTPGGRYLEIENRVLAHREEYTSTLLESRKLLGEQLAMDSGAKILYESSVCGVYLEKNTVCGVRVITTEGLKSISCKVLMDCTGDAYTAYMAGCEMQYGRKLDGLTQPYSMVSYLWSEDKRGTSLTNIDCGRVDQYNDWELSRALIFARCSGTENWQPQRQFLFHMPLLGVREGRRIVSEEDITLEDIFAGKFTGTPILYSYADLDKHGWDIAFDGEVLGDWVIGANLGAYNLTIPVSYKTIIPKKIEGLLVPCRALGVDRDVSSCVRMLSDMRKLAEAAADMAMLALKYECSLRKIPYEELRERLVASKCLERTYECTYRRDGLRDSAKKPLPAVDVRFVSDPAKLEEKLETMCPGEAIWASKLMGPKAVPTLKKLLTSKKEDTRKHAAFALAMAGDNTGNEVLRDMVIERDGTMLQDGRKLNQQRGCMAMYLLGRLGDVEIADTLIEIISDEEEVLRPVYQREFIRGTRYRIEGFKNEYFQFVSNAVMALIRIAEAHPEQRKKVIAAFYKTFGDGTYYNRITSLSRQSCEGDMVENIGRVALEAARKFEQGDCQEG